MDSRIIDVAIGLVLVFALTSLLVTTLVEVWATMRKQRGRVLQQAVASFVGDDATFATSLLRHPLIVSLAPSSVDADRRPSYIGADVMVTSVIGHLAQQFTGGIRPSSPAELVAAVQAGGLTAAMASGPQPNSQFTNGLVSLVLGVENDWAAYEKRLQAWYESVTERSIGWYKRWTQWYLFGIGFAVALAMNINPLVIAPRLWNDAALREAMANAGVAASKSYEEAQAANAAPEFGGTGQANGGAGGTGTATNGNANTGGSTNTGGSANTGAPNNAAGNTNSTNTQTPAASQLPALVQQTTAQRVAGKIEATADSYARLKQALIAAAEEVRQRPGDRGAANRRAMLEKVEALKDQFPLMRAQDDGSAASVSIRADANAIIDRVLTQVGTLMPDDAAYADARRHRSALVAAIAAERGSLANVSTKRLRDCAGTEDPAAKELCLRLNDLSTLQEAGLPIGWNTNAWPNVAPEKKCEPTTPGAAATDCGDNSWHIFNIGTALGGWIITAFGVLLGAPFWFDMLSRLVKLRGAGTRVDGEPAEKGKPTTTSPASTMALLSSPDSIAVAGAPLVSLPMSDALNTAEATLTPIEVERMQRALGLSDAQVTGFFDTNTRAAIKQWQTLNGFDPTGELTQTQIQQLLQLGQGGGDDEYAG